jgi:hypothetical protein
MGAIETPAHGAIVKAAPSRRDENADACHGGVTPEAHAGAGG